MDKCGNLSDSGFNKSIAYIYNFKNIVTVHAGAFLKFFTLMSLCDIIDEPSNGCQIIFSGLE